MVANFHLGRGPGGRAADSVDVGSVIGFLLHLSVVLGRIARRATQNEYSHYTRFAATATLEGFRPDKKVPLHVNLAADVTF